MHIYMCVCDFVQITSSVDGVNDTSKDEQLARELQAQLNRDTVVLASPAQPAQLPYSCGACGTTHAVRNVTHGSKFTCTVCGVENRILLQQQQRPIVVVYVPCSALSLSSELAASPHACFVVVVAIRIPSRSPCFAPSSSVRTQPMGETRRKNTHSPRWG